MLTESPSKPIDYFAWGLTESLDLTSVPQISSHMGTTPLAFYFEFHFAILVPDQFEVSNLLSESSFSKPVVFVHTSSYP